MADYRPVRPGVDHDAELWTFRDIVEFVVDTLGANPDERTLRRVKTAVLNAYRDFPNKTRWKYYDRRVVIVTAASETGTCAYDHTGGTYERELTLTGITATSDHRYYRAIIDDTHYNIEDQKTSSIVTLDRYSNPGQDVAAGTSITLYRDAYPFPVPFRKLGRVYDTANEHEIQIIGDDVQHAESLWYYDTPDTPWKAAIRNTGEFFGSQEIVFSPPPDSIREYDCLIEAKPIPLLVYNESTGTVTTDGTTTVEGSNTSFSDKHVANVLRVSGDGTTEPTNIAGGLEHTNPYEAQRVVQSVTDSDTLEVDTAISTLTSVKYRLSSVLDIEPNVMFTAFQTLCTAEAAKLLGRDDATHWRNLAYAEIRQAMEADQRAAYARRGRIIYNWFSRVNVTTDDGPSGI